MDIFDRIASEFKKEARISKGDKESKNEEAKTKNYAEWLENLKEKNPKGYAEWTKYEGAFDPSTGKMNPDRIKKNEGQGSGGGADISALGQMGKKKAAFYDDDEIIDDLGLDRVASSASWRTSTFSVDGNPPEIGEQILADNDNDPEVQEILEEVFRTGRPYRGFNMASVSLIKKASFYGSDWGRLSPSSSSLSPSDRSRFRGEKPLKPWAMKQEIVARINFLKKQRRLSREEEQELSELKKVDLGKKASFYDDDEIIDDLGLDRVASDEGSDHLADELTLLAEELQSEELMLLAEELMSAGLSSRIRSRISKGVSKALRGSGLKDRTKKMNKTLKKPRTQASKARGRIRKRKRYDRHQR